MKDRSAKDRNLVLRGETWYFRKTFGERTVWRSLHTTSVSTARLRRDDLLWKLDHGASMEPKPIPTIQQCLVAFEIVANLRGLKPVTITGYKSALRTIIRTCGRKGDFMYPVSILSRKMVLQYASSVLSQSKNKDRSRITIRSTLAQARSIFSKWAISEAYDNFTMPDSLRGFLNANPVRPVAVKYTCPGDDLRRATERAGCSLLGKNKPLYIAYSLCYHVGLRATEAKNAQWAHLAKTDGEHYRLRVKGKRDKVRYVPVHKEIVDSWGDANGNYILPGATRTARHTLITRTLASWMIEIGWDAYVYSKRAHELRKLRGSIWYTTYGAEVAQTWLGHDNVATTCKYYTDLTKHPEPLAS